jgi:glycosyltransferase involved in cell wall biosynthesis
MNSSLSWGGLEMNIVRLASYLMGANIEVILFCLENSPINSAAKQINIPTVNIEKHRKYFDLCKSYKLCKLFEKQVITHIFIFDNRDLSTGVLAKIFLGENTELIFQQQMLVVTDKKDIFHRWHYSHISQWISPLQVLKRQVLQHTLIPARKISVIPLCIDIANLLPQNIISKREAREQLHINADATLFGIIGRIDKLKGQHFLIEAIKRLRNENYDVELLIVGEPTKEKAGEEYLQHILQLVKELDLGNCIHFRPFSQDLNLLYSALDIFALASKNETYGMVTVEAMLFGKPIIATSSGGTPEILGDGKFGLLYENEDMDGFLSCAKKYLDNVNLQNEFGRKAKEEAMHKYSHTVEVEQIIEMLSKLSHP